MDEVARRVVVATLFPFDDREQDLAHGREDRPDFGGREPIHRAARRDRRLEQRLVGVQVADPGDDVLRHQQRLQVYRQLITVQEEERREIANELHDEAGPCLFGITANASSIQNFADQLPEGRPGEMISRRVGEILSITERLKLLNRALLKKLQPGPLGRVKLSELLDELVAGFQRRHPDTDISISFGTLADFTERRSISRSIAASRKASPTPSVTARRARWPSMSWRRRPRAGTAASSGANASASPSATMARALRPPRPRASASPP